MKTLLALALVCLSALAAHGQANLQTILDGGTNNVAGSSTRTFSDTLIPAVVNTNIALQATFNLVSAGTANVTFKFDISADGVLWESNRVTWGVPATGTTTNSILTNIEVGAMCFLRLNTIADGNAAAVTNLILKASQKRKVFPL